MIANSETSGPSRNSSITTRSHWAAWAAAASRSSVTTTPLPAARPSSLTTYGGPNASSAAAASSGVVQTCAIAVGTPAAAITSLANALDPSSSAAARDGPEAADPAVADGVGDPRDEGRLGPDDDEVGADLLREGGHGITVELVDRVQRGEGRDPRVAGRCVDLLDGRVAREREREGVLAASGADDEDLHAARC